MENKTLIGLLIIFVLFLGASTDIFNDITGYTTIENHPPTTILIAPGYNWVIHTNKLTLKWNYQDLENDPQTAFMIQIDKTIRMEDPNSKTIASPSTSYQLTIRNPEETTYYWRVKTKDTHEWGEWSKPWKFSLDLNIKECSDNTPLWQCSLNKPKWCYRVINTPILVDKCSKCGCLDGYECKEDDTCKPISCTDGTLHGKCSIKLPKYCDKGNLIYDCEKCGCLLGKTCQPDGTCSSKKIF